MHEFPNVLGVMRREEIGRKRGTRSKVVAGKGNSGQRFGVSEFVENEHLKKSNILPGRGQAGVCRSAGAAGRNLATGTTIQIPAKTVLKFKIAKMRLRLLAAKV